MCERVGNARHERDGNMTTDGRWETASNSLISILFLFASFMAWLHWESVKVQEFITVAVYRISRAIESLAYTVAGASDPTGNGIR